MLRRPRCLWNHFQSLPHIFLKEWPGRAKPMGTPHVWSPYRPCATAKFWTESFAAPNWHSYWHCLFPCCLCGLATQPGHSFSMLLRWCFFDLSEDDSCTAVPGGAYKNSQDLDVLFGIFYWTSSVNFHGGCHMLHTIASMIQVCVGRKSWTCLNLLFLCLTVTVRLRPFFFWWAGRFLKGIEGCRVLMFTVMDVYCL